MRIHGKETTALFLPSRLLAIGGVLSQGKELTHYGWSNTHSGSCSGSDLNYALYFLRTG
jgi:hypothetical protein